MTDLDTAKAMMADPILFTNNQISDALRGLIAEVERLKKPVFCHYCGGNDEDPVDHCTDCELAAAQAETEKLRLKLDANASRRATLRYQRDAAQAEVERLTKERDDYNITAGMYCMKWEDEQAKVRELVEVLRKTLVSMEASVSWQETRIGRPPNQTCLFEIEGARAAIAKYGEQK